MPNMDNKTLARVMKYYKKHVKELEEDDNMKKWDTQFADVAEAILCNLLMATNYLNISSLLDLVARKVVDPIH